MARCDQNSIAACRGRHSRVVPRTSGKDGEVAPFLRNAIVTGAAQVVKSNRLKTHSAPKREYA